MQKLITLTPEQYDAALALMKELRIKSFSQFIHHLVLFYEREGTKRSVGRPKSSAKHDDDEDDGVARYQSPDYPKTKSRYTKAEVDSWYDFRGLAVPEGAYKAHPDVSA